MPFKGDLWVFKGFNATARLDSCGSKTNIILIFNILFL